MSTQEDSPISFEETVASSPSKEGAAPAQVVRLPELPGGLAARYEILGEVARGGMGVIYRARHRALDVAVAIKVLLPGQAAERFLREAQIVARVQSPHVVRVHDFDVLADGSPMLVMEWVPGRDLLETMRARGGRIDEETALGWMRQVAAGMSAVEALGIVHRDLKPSNILIDEQGAARVADFGLARGPVDTETRAPGGEIMGTPFYMAPEQAMDPRTVDTRADIYSFGATFYHALTGQPPFVGDSLLAVLFKHQTAPLIAPRTLVPELSERTGDLLERCLAKSPSERFQSFADVALQLDPSADGPLPWEAWNDREIATYLDDYQRRRGAYVGPGPVAAGIVDEYPFPEGRRLRIVSGNIVDQAVEAVVSSDDEHITMGSAYDGGGVAAAILRAAGPEVAAEARRFIPVRPGRAVVTSAGRLRARFIFHGITLGLTPERRARPSRDLISEITASCLYHADTLGVRTIAFPLLGTGTGGFPRDVCLDTMSRVLGRALRRGTTSVREATIVLYARPG